jgi:FAD/FMN-containing dehydrogenase
MATLTADWDALAAAIDGEVVLPGSERYERARKPFIARFDELEPTAVVLVAEPEDVAETMRFATAAGIPTAIRSGGHCFAGYSSTEGIVVDVSPIDHVDASDGLVRVGAGARIGPIVEHLLEHGLTIPTGSCPSVGIAGTTLGGGLGVLGRKYGLTLDHLEAARVVLADGRVVECDEHHEPDLFWALRGAGAGNFGVVTEFTFRPRPAHDMTNFYLVWPFEHAARVMAVWQEWAPNADDDLAAGLAYSQLGEDRPIVEIFGAAVAREGPARALLEDAVARIGVDPESERIEELTFGGTSNYQAALLAVANDQVEETAAGTVERQGCRFTRSEFFSRPIPPDGLEALAAAFVDGLEPGMFRGLELAPWGGAYNRVPPDATAFVHRRESFSLKEASLVAPEASDAEKHAAWSWVSHSWRSVHPYGSGRVYPNFPDPDLTGWLDAYYGTNLPRLRRVKAAYDPGEVFRFEQSIPPA